MKHPFFDEGGAREGNLYTPIDDASVVEGALNFDFEKLKHPSLSDIKTLLYEEVARFNEKVSHEGGLTQSESLVTSAKKSDHEGEESTDHPPSPSKKPKIAEGKN